MHTHIDLQCETIKVIQQCKMEERLQLRPIRCIRRHCNICEKSVMKPITHTQHRPIGVRVDPVIVAHPTPFRRRFILRKADWNVYSAALDKLIEHVQPIPEKYRGFVKCVLAASRRYIPRG